MFTAQREACAALRCTIFLAGAGALLCALLCHISRLEHHSALLPLFQNFLPERTLPCCHTLCCYRSWGRRIRLFSWVRPQTRPILSNPKRKQRFWMPGFSRQHCRLNIWRYIGWADKCSIGSQDPNNLFDSETRCLVLNFPGSTYCSFYSTTLFSSVLLR